MAEPLTPEQLDDLRYGAGPGPRTQTIGHTDEARALVLAGTVRPGDPALDVPIDSMSDREIMAELLVHARNTRDAVAAFVNGVNESPIGRMIAGGGNPLAGMFSGGSTAG